MLKLLRKKKTLPKGFKAAPPIKNKKLRELLMGATSRGAVEPIRCPTHIVFSAANGFIVE
jgi:hypothetical protein